MALIAGFDLSTRILLSVLSIFISFNARYMYTAGTVASIMLRFGTSLNYRRLAIWTIWKCVFDDFVVFLSVSEFRGIAIVAALMGSLRTFVHVPTPLVIAAYLPKERYIFYFQQIKYQRFSFFNSFSDLSPATAFIYFFKDSSYFWLVHLSVGYVMWPRAMWFAFMHLHFLWDCVQCLGSLKLYGFVYIREKSNQIQNERMYSISDLFKFSKVIRNHQRKNSLEITVLTSINNNLIRASHTNHVFLISLFCL